MGSTSTSGVPCPRRHMLHRRRAVCGRVGSHRGRNKPASRDRSCQLLGLAARPCWTRATSTPRSPHDSPPTSPGSARWTVSSSASRSQQQRCGAHPDVGGTVRTRRRGDAVVRSSPRSSRPGCNRRVHRSVRAVLTPGDSGQLAGAIRAAARLGRDDCRRFAAATLSLSVMLQRYIGLYEQGRSTCPLPREMNNEGFRQQRVGPASRL